MTICVENSIINFRGKYISAVICLKVKNKIAFDEVILLKILVLLIIFFSRVILKCTENIFPFDTPT